MIKEGWLPQLSPFGLIQETCFPDEWLVLVSCMMLNQTSRKQVEKVFPGFVKRWPKPINLLHSPRSEIVEACKTLGFANRRTDNLFKMSEKFVASPWQHARELPGVGPYAARAWEIFCLGIVGDEPPKDHALIKYWIWRKKHDKTPESRSR